VKWPLVPLSTALERIEPGRSPRAQERPANVGEFGVLKLSAISWGNFVPNENKALLPDTDTNGCPRVCANDLLMSRANTTELVGAVVLVEQDYPNLLLSDKTLRLVPKPQIGHGRFLLYALRTPSARDHIERCATGTSFSMRNISQEKISATPIPLPPLAEQRRIAEVLDRAEALRAKRRAALAQLDSLTQSLFLDLFGDPATNPKGWPVSRVGDVADVQGGLQVTTARKNLPYEVPYLRVANVYRGFLELREIKTIRATDVEIARTTLVKDDLLIVEGHGNPAEIGRGALWDGSIAGCIHQNHIIRARFASAKVVPLYACEYLNSPGGRRHLLRAGKTTTGLNTICVSEVRGTPVALPPISLQCEFARRATAVEALKTAQRASLAELDALFATLQHRAFRGEL
jgi:type I restriction enzyme S subunit